MKNFSDEIVKSAITNNIKNQNTVFVFATQIAASMWADYTLEFSGVTAVAMERFIAWDDFKGSSIKSHQADRTSVPSTMRLVFAENIIRQNAENPFLKSIVKVEFAKTATRFSSWIANILPSLALWKKHFESAGCVRDEEDDDYYEIYNRYQKFLDDNNLFDPAWETPPFNSDGKKYIIFFPEILMDYSEYKELLESSEDIELVHIPSEYYDLPKPVGHLYSNTRIELKEVISYLWQMHDKENIKWNEIAISVPDLDTYGPYLERDLELYQIPHIMKNGKALSSTGAGKLFSQIQNCYAEQFSFESVKNLLLNKELPWNNDEVIESLIKFGQANNCLCSFEYQGKQVDVWKKSFETPVGKEEYERESTFYSELKKIISAIAVADSFSKIRSEYFIFRDKFFDFSKENFSVQNDKILSRCIAELGSLIDLEETYKSSGMFEMESCFSFFCSYLDDKMYVAQNDTQGIAVLPFKTASTAPFKVHVVLDASQGSSSVVYKKLQFLRNDKRSALGFNDEDNVTENFILLYEMVSQVVTLFTCSTKTIDGYAFINSYLTEHDHNQKKDYADETFITSDAYRKEKDSFVTCDAKKFPEKIFISEKTGFDNFVRLGNSTGEISDETRQRFFDKIESKLYQNVKNDPDLRVIKTSHSAVTSFFRCPRAYLLEKVLEVKEQDNVAELISPYTQGNVNHKILELFFTALKENNYPLLYLPESDDFPENYKPILSKSIDEALNSRELSYLTRQILLTEKQKITDTIFATVKDLMEYFNDFKVAEIEEWHNYLSKEDDYIINCKIDCLLISPDGEYVLVDFKNAAGAIPKNVYVTEDNAIPDFQMPFYKYVYEREKVSKHISACIFFDIQTCTKSVVYSELDDYVRSARIENAVINEKFDEAQKVALECLEKYVQAVKERSFDISIADITIDDCLGCSYESICRRTFAINQKRD
ncbi:MAG: PD-(D/E)XK nuclease family protein [Treponema sp.]|nr:PD-(D/E)XK nuclease family protein [Candidatus Treponema scatequi]